MSVKLGPWVSERRTTGRLILYCLRFSKQYELFIYPSSKATRVWWKILKEIACLLICFGSNAHSKHLWNLVCIRLAKEVFTWVYIFRSRIWWELLKYSWKWNSMTPIFRDTVNWFLNVHTWCYICLAFYFDILYTRLPNHIMTLSMYFVDHIVHALTLVCIQYQLLLSNSSCVMSPAYCNCKLSSFVR